MAGITVMKAHNRYVGQLLCNQKHNRYAGAHNETHYGTRHNRYVDPVVMHGLNCYVQQLRYVGHINVRFNVGDRHCVFTFILLFSVVIYVYCVVFQAFRSSIHIIFVKLFTCIITVLRAVNSFYQVFFSREMNELYVLRLDQETELLDFCCVQFPCMRRFGRFNHLIQKHPYSFFGIIRKPCFQDVF